MATYDENSFDGPAGLGELTHDLKQGLLDAMDVAKGAAGVDPDDTDLAMDSYAHFTALAVYKFVKSFIEEHLEMTGEIVDPTVATLVETKGSAAAQTGEGSGAVENPETKSTEFVIDDEFTEDPTQGEIDKFGNKKAE